MNHDLFTELAAGTGVLIVGAVGHQIVRRLGQVIDRLDDWRQDVAETIATVAGLPVKEEEVRRRFIRLERHVGLLPWRVSDLHVRVRDVHQEETGGAGVDEALGSRSDER